MSQLTDSNAPVEGQASRPWWFWAGLVGLVLILLAAWRWTPLSELARPEVLKGWIDSYLESPWAPLVLCIAYCVANLVLFPNMVVNLAVILAMGPWIGVPAALAGSLLAGVMAYLLGRQIGRRNGSAMRQGKLGSALDLVRRSGMPGMILLRMIPVAPYPLVNLALGAGAVKMDVFLIGSAIGIFPSLLAMGAFGLSLDAVWTDPSLEGGLMIGAIIASYLVLIYWLRRSLQARVGEPGRALSSDC